MARGAVRVREGIRCSSSHCLHFCSERRKNISTCLGPLVVGVVVKNRSSRLWEQQRVWRWHVVGIPNLNVSWRATGDGGTEQAVELFDLVAGAGRQVGFCVGLEEGREERGLRDGQLRHCVAGPVGSTACG